MDNVNVLIKLKIHLLSLPDITLTRQSLSKMGCGYLTLSKQIL